MPAVAAGPVLAPAEDVFNPNHRRPSYAIWPMGGGGGLGPSPHLPKTFHYVGANRSPVAFSPALFLPRQRRKRGRNGKEREGKPSPRPPWAPWQVPGRFLGIRPQGNRPGAWLGGRAGAAAGCFNPKNLKTYCMKRRKCLYSIKRKSGVICAKNLKAGTWILS